MSRIINLVLIIFFMQILPSKAFAVFGDSCSMPSEKSVSTDVLNYLRNNSAYGFVRSLMDVDNCGENFKNGCLDRGKDKFTVCVRQMLSGVAKADKDNSLTFDLPIGSSVKLGDLALGITEIQSNISMKNILIRTEKIEDNICMFMSSTNGEVPIICRKFVDATDHVPTGAGIYRDMAQCREISGVCNINSAKNPSKTQNSYLGPLVQCVRESIDLVFFDPTTCVSRNMSSDIEKYFEAETKVKPFAEFYSVMQKAVAAAITLYVIFYGINIALKPEEFDAKDAFLSVAKILLVIYFSIGNTAINWFTGKSSNNNGVTQLMLPFMLDLSNSLSSYVLNQSDESGLCNFSAKDYLTEQSYYAIWDAMDCRLNTYAGVNRLFWEQERLSGSTLVSLPNFPSTRINYELSDDLPSALKPISKDNIEAKAKFLQNSSLILGASPDTSGTIADISRGWDEAGNVSKSVGLFFIIVIFLFSGGIIPFIVLGMLIIMIAGMFFSIVLSFILSISLLYILAYLAPIFVPMALFERTKGFFRGWFQLTLSTAIQPVIILGFVAFILTLVDSFMFDKCLFAKYQNNITGKYEFELRLPQSPDDSIACKKSIGYKIMQLVQYPYGWNETNYLLFKVVRLDDIYDIGGSAWTGLIMIYLLLFILDKVYQLSSDLTGGINLDNLTTKPSVFFGMMQKTFRGANNLRKEISASDKAKSQFKSGD
jgi:type IV secretion system protein VirB6